MTESTESAGAVRAAAPMPSFWEDVIEIFVHPVDVMRRRANAGFWAPFLFATILIGVIGVTTFETLQPLFEAEMVRSMAASGQPMTDQQQATGVAVGLKIARFGFPVLIAFSEIVLGFAVWLVSKMFSAKTTLGQAFVIVAWAYFPRILGSIAAGVQGLFLDISTMSSIQSISLSPARFMDATTANPVLFQLAGRFDLTILWETVLLAIGVYVTGKISKNAAVWFGVVIFLLGSLSAVRQGFLLMK